MSEPKLISPMLDNFVMGSSINEHDGVCCFPAINKDTNDKYIVKVISVPATQTQLDALLISGAYDSKEAALNYFKSVAEDITAECDVLQKLSQLEGFSPVESCQVVAKDDGCGYDVYLLSTYRNTLHNHLRRGTMTHLSALNLGLDLCSALSVARRTGYLCINIKPTNIYINGTQEFKIGDIGFIALNSLQYASMPDRYRSEYTAPEIADAFSELNKTIDTYAVGKILYQVFNGGLLPVEKSGVELPAPVYADYEMAEIILKACALNPADRWQDPVEMGQALVSYMQCNGAHDTPIVPEAVPEMPADVTSEESTTGLYEQTDEPEAVEEITATEATEEEDVDNAVPVIVDAADNDAVEPTEDTTEALAEVSEEAIFTEDQDGNLTLIEEPDEGNEAPPENEPEDYENLSDEVSDMLLQADELITHEVPAPVVQPEPIDVPIPDPIILVDAEPASEEAVTDNTPNADEPAGEEETVESDENNSSEEIAVVTDVAEDALPQEAAEADPEEIYSEDFDSPEETQEPKKKRFAWVIWLIAILAAAALAVGGFWGYKNYYLQNVEALELTLETGSTLIVKVKTTANEGDLTVVCTDTYGNSRKASVINGIATFTNLTPDTAYNIKVTISGLHKLTGKTTDSIATLAQTEIINFEALTDVIDGSVYLSFAVNGPNVDQWNISFKNHNGDVENFICTGNATTIQGLQVGNEYEFTLTPITDANVIGNNVVKYTAKQSVKAANLTVTQCYDKKLTVVWNNGTDATASGWTVRCYNETYNETLVVNECTASFDIPDDKADYTIEVTALEMSRNTSTLTRVPKNATTITDFTIAENETGKLELSWNCAGVVPEDGFILTYTVDGFVAPHIAVTEENRVTIENIVPGATYTFQLLTAENVVALNGKKEHTTAEAPVFKGYNVEAKHMVFSMCLTPEKENWTYADANKMDYRNEFTSGEKISFVVKLNASYKTSSDKITTVYVVRDAEGNIVNISSNTRSWTDMWRKGYCKLDIPETPAEAGVYNVSVYFNGAYANTTEFTVTE